MAEVEQEPIALRVSRSSRTKRFDTNEAVIEWIDSEASAWSPIARHGSSGRTNTPEEVAGRAVKLSLDRLHRLAQRDLDPGPETAAAHRAELQEAFAEVYGEGRLFASESVEGRFVLSEASALRQASRFLALTDSSGPLLNRNHELTGDLIGGYVEGALFRKRISRDVERVVDEGLNSLALEHDEALSHLLRERDEQLTKLLEQRSHSLELLTTSIRDSTSALADQREREEAEFSVLLEDWRGRLDDWEARLKQRLALEAPMDYWSTKAEGHGRKVIWTSTAAVVAGVGFGFVFVWLALSVLVGDTLSQGDYARIIVLVTVATLMMWALRIVVRVLLSELHLQSDAREREVILKTFTALDANEHARLTEEDRRLLLAYVFRPASTGIVQDDSAPLSVAEVLSRFGTRS